MDNIRRTNRNSLIGLYLDYTEHQLNELIKTNTNMVDQNNKFLSQDNIDTIKEANDQIEKAIAKIATLMPGFRINKTES